PPDLVSEGPAPHAAPHPAVPLAAAGLRRRRGIRLHLRGEPRSCGGGERGGGEQRGDVRGQASAHRAPPAPFLAGDAGRGAAAFTNVRVPSCASSSAPAASP